MMMMMIDICREQQVVIAWWNVAVSWATLRCTMLLRMVM